MSWEPPNPTNGNITDYNYTCVGINTTFNTPEMTPNTPSLMSVIISGLKPFREYQCSVTAATSAGVGPPGTVNAVTNQDGMYNCIV